MLNYFRRMSAVVLCAGLLCAEGRAETAEEMHLPNPGTLGVFDPAIARHSTAARTWLLYSAVDRLSSDEERGVSLRLAWYDAVDESWRGVPSPASMQFLEGGARWQAEVGTLFYDPVGRSWRLLFHRYLHADGERQFEHGWIAMKQAESPELLVHVPEQRWLAGWRYEESVEATLSAKAFDLLRECITFSEPGSFANQQAVYLSFSCPAYKLFNGIRTGLVMLRCEQPCAFDDPSAWQVIETPFGREEAKGLGLKGFSGAEILKVEEAWVYMSVTPVLDEPFADAYKGCWLVRFKPGSEGFEWVRKLSVESPFEGACDVWPENSSTLVSTLQLLPDLRFKIERRN